MPAVISAELFQVARDLAIAGLIYLAYSNARNAVERAGRIAILFRGLGWVLGIAAFASFSVGRPSCEDSDPLYGGCEQYADDGYEASGDQRFAVFIYWALVFGVPVVMGVMAGNVDHRNPWGRPDKREG